MSACGDGYKSSWPKIKYKSDLQITRFKDMELFAVPNFLTPAESKSFIAAAELYGFTHQGSGGSAKGEAFRDNDRISMIDPILSKQIWESGLKNVFGDLRLNGKHAVGLNPNMRFYRYKVGQRFGQHIDESVDLGGGQKKYYTLLIYLAGEMDNRGGSKHSQSLIGGETVFYKRGGIVAEVKPAEGMALLHIHGDKCLIHEARTVKKGVKYVFRSDVIFA